MRNVINEIPTHDLHGRLLFSTKFVTITDLTDKDVLDIGCGFGWFENFALEKGVKSITGTEITELDLATAKQNILNPKATFKVGDAISLPFLEQTFDTVVSWEVIEHIPKNEEMNMFREVFRVLKPGGSFYLSTPHNSFFSKLFDPAWWLIGHRHYSLKQLKKFGESAGFQPFMSEIKGRFWSIFGTLNMYFCKWVLKRKPLMESMMQKKIDTEYDNPGFVDIFIRFQKK
jgi:SAM-dependent methyltransferase